MRSVSGATSAAVASLGLIPVPHLAARRIASAQALDHILRGLQRDGTSNHVLAVAGDPAAPEGYGVLPTHRAARIGPERLVADLAERLKPAVHGDVRLHLFSHLSARPLEAVHPLSAD